MSEKESHVPPPEGDTKTPDLSSIRGMEDYILLLSPMSDGRIDFIQKEEGSGYQPQYYDSLEQAQQAAALTPILFFKDIASSVLITFADGGVVEVVPIQEIGELEGGTDPKTPISRLRMSGEYKLAPEIVAELLALPTKSQHIKEAKLVYWQSNQNLIPPEK